LVQVLELLLRQAKWFAGNVVLPVRLYIKALEQDGLGDRADLPNAFERGTASIFLRTKPNLAGR
jgi:hypothetical protein